MVRRLKRKIFSQLIRYKLRQDSFMTPRYDDKIGVLSTSDKIGVFFLQPKSRRSAVPSGLCCHEHDNATPHSANLTQQWLQRYDWKILPHLAHSPDLAPSDFHLFGPLKRHLEGMAFETEDYLISELRNWFDNLDIDFFRVGINSLLSRWQKCIDLHGDYVEK
ncbi:histone-lysine N-methyltransferase SETMAR [Plakobranchus ocellatus]|uniref:Histone-lysine N-methyltransferase SETMAR n=1 Tax=Plakobranchus ocellatus TaxID=259542 RepID=A0AAV4CND5_9GAST|nr:histone-lysine N-methyltransferase SETMAR [Plakobranchus ocellatus]